jgi:transcriptional regulator with XRE-family HTH domain
MAVERNCQSAGFGVIMGNDARGVDMRVEVAIGKQIARFRETQQMSLTQLGEAMGQYLDRPWSRQAVHQAERGRRAFTAAELAALALVLGTSVPALFLADAEQIELPGATVSPEDYQAMLLYAGNDAPLDGVEELIVALHDIAQVLSRPTLARLAKIGRVAEQVASAPPAAAGPGRQRTPATSPRPGPRLADPASR